MRRALDKRDRGALLSLLAEHPLATRDRVDVLLQLSGAPSILAEARRRLPECGDALDELDGVLEQLGAGANVVVDLAHVRVPAYYTGLVFDVYADGAPRPLAGGGRYDGLAAHWGPDRPAVGVTFDLDGLAALVGPPPGSTP